MADLGGQSAMRIFGLAAGRFVGDEVLIDHFAVAARLADFDANGAVNLKPLWIDAGGDFDWREPGDFALMLFDFKAGPNRAGFYPRAWRGLGAKGSEQSVVGRVDEVDFGRLRAAGRLSDGIRMLAGGNASSDREYRRLVGSCGRKAGARSWRTRRCRPRCRTGRVARADRRR